jgi:holliday junction DNA helicase RuvA
MICCLNGVLFRKTKTWAEVLVGGVGYQVWTHKRVLEEVEVGEEIVLYTHLHLAEGVMDLYGFLEKEEVEVFKLLISVSGVGPKTAMGIFGDYGAEEIIGAVSKADVSFFEKVKGIGKKGAQRIIVDLKSKVGGLGELDFSEDKIEEDEVYLGLKSLGFLKAEIELVLGKIPKKMKSMEEKMAWCLGELGGRE